MFKKYLDYFKHNPHHYWFKRKIWGWGWIPVTWQGWLVTMIALALIVGGVYVGEIDDAPGAALFGFLLSVALVFGFGFYKGEKPQWQWGLPEDGQLLESNFTHMEKLTFTTIINAPREKVWNTMLEKDTYQEWTALFYEGSTYEGNWEEGSEMRFVGPSEDGSVSGMYAVIAENRLHEFISIKHVGEFKNGEKSPWPVVEGQEGYENYTFKDADGGTEVLVELTIPAEWKDMMNDMWPKALAKLKEIAER